MTNDPVRQKIAALLRPGRDGWSAEDCCGDCEHGHDLLVPYGLEPTGHAWLHSRCWEAWHAARKREAVAALKAMGVGKLRATE